MFRIQRPPLAQLRSRYDPDITFNLGDGSLKGYVDQTPISTFAKSGGRGNTKTEGAEVNLLVNNVFSAGVKHTTKDTVGGSLPIGFYQITPHEKKERQKLCMTRRTPLDVPNLHNRDGLLIHGRGQRGSDGCVVPLDFEVVQDIYHCAVKRQQERRKPLILEVVAVGQDLDWALTRA